MRELDIEAVGLSPARDGLGEGFVLSERLLHQAGGRRLGPALPAPSRRKTGGKGCGCCGEPAPTAAKICWNLCELAASTAGLTLTQAKTPSERNLARRLRLSSSRGTGSNSSSASRTASPSSL